MRKKLIFKRYIARRFFIRFHMSLILIGTLFSGLLLSKLLLLMSLEKMLIRYPLVIFLSYGCFFVFIRLWLLYIKYREKFIENACDATFDIVSNINVSSGESLSKTIECGGGKFGGGGATESFEYINNSISNESSSSFIGEAAGEVGGGFIEEGGVIIIPLMLLLAVIFGAGIFLIYQAPIILSEVAFEFVLTSALLKKAKEMDNPDWVGSVLKNTWKPFSFTLLLVIFVTAFLSYSYPEAVKISQILPMISSK